MITSDKPISSSSSSLQTILPYFIAAAPVVNLIALAGSGQSFWFSVSQGFAFLYLIVTPGLFFLPILMRKKLSFGLGIAFSLAVSIFLLMILGLAINTFLPLFGVTTPLTTIPLLIGFDFMIFVLFVLNARRTTEFMIDHPHFDKANFAVIMAAIILPVLAYFGAISINNSGSNILTMLGIMLIVILVLVSIFCADNLNEETPPIILYFMALALLLMNSMRGWFITGHDILLEYHVYSLVSNAHMWSMALYHDPYMACLSITILPVYFQNILHASGTFIFKFFMQFIGAMPVVFLYYLCKKYVSNTAAFLSGFLYLSFPTFMTDMAFLTRQNIGFLFFGAMVFCILSPELFSERTRNIFLLIFGTGMIVSHYSTSYVAIALIVIAYLINRILRVVKKAGKPILLTLPFVFVLICLAATWSVFITNTSGGFFATAGQILKNLENPFHIGSNTGPAEYSILQAQKSTPQETFSQFLQANLKQSQSNSSPSNFYPLSLAESYSTTPIEEPTTALTAFGIGLQSILHIDLGVFYTSIKEIYAKIVQVLLLLGVLGFLLGYKFKSNLLRAVPTEYVALSMAGVAILAGQTLLPASAVAYGLLRLFQQNLFLLALPITLMILYLGSLITRNQLGGTFLYGAILLFFFIIFSGFFPQLTGAARPSLALNNSGLYYDAYYTHAQEINSMEWLVQNANRSLPVQSDRYFAGTKMLAYSGIAPVQGLLPETIEKNAYVFLDFNNVHTGTVIDDFMGNIMYYRFPINFLSNQKNLLYNNGGSEIYR